VNPSKCFDDLAATHAGEDPLDTLTAAGRLGVAVLQALARDYTTRPIRSDAALKEKRYVVVTPHPADRPMSRPIRPDLFVADHRVFERKWDALVARFARSRGAGAIAGGNADSVNGLIYTVVIGYGALSNMVTPGDRQRPGQVLEKVTGAAVALLSGRLVDGSVYIPIPGASPERVTLDLSFRDAKSGEILAVPTKISTRERISQAYVHQRILDSAMPGKVRSVLVAANETNISTPRGEVASATTSSVKETLVHRQIAMYQKYVAQLSGVYYLDPPALYRNATPAMGLPHVGTVGELLVDDLPRLL
jgi:hypothetical protein